jgi:16S rRNA (guanine966-N2)-methyltransferase
VRIIAGKAKGHALAAPKGRETRPTSDRIREAIFNVLAHGAAAMPLEGQRVLDLFAGTGAMGLEALSRGARFCLFVEDDPEARSVIRSNAEALGFTGMCKIWRRDATRLGRCAPQPPFGLAFIDPPYDKSLSTAALLCLVEGEWLCPSAVVMVEESSRATIAVPGQLTLIEERVYGDTKVIFLRR